MKYRYTRLAPGTLADGKPLAFDDEVELSEEEAQDEYNSFLFEDGRLIPIDEVSTSKSSKKKEE